MSEIKATKKVKVPPKPQAEQKKKKKKDPLTPQPKWLFPPDDENPVLNPKQKTEEILKQEKEERGKALKYMQRRVHNVPDRPSPPPQLLTMIGVFLTEFGFNSTSRIFSNERKGRQQLEGWEDAIGKKLEKGTPKLEKIYRDWYRQWKIAQKDETSSSEIGSGTSTDSEGDAAVDTSLVKRDSSEDDSEASSDGFGGSDVETKGALRVKKGESTKKTATLSSGSSSSDSDADDEEESVKPKAAVAIKKVATKTSKPTVDGMRNILKRKAVSGASERTNTDSDSGSIQGVRLPQAKKPKVRATSTTAPTEPSQAQKRSAKKAAKEVSSSSSSDDSSSSSSSSDAEPSKPRTVNGLGVSANKPVMRSKNANSSSSSDSRLGSSSNAGTSSKKPTPRTAMAGLSKTTPISQHACSSDSSVTINGDAKKPSTSITPASKSTSATSSSADSDLQNAPATSATLSSKKPDASVSKTHRGAKPTPLAELSAAAPDDGYLSNKYQSYDYADKAYKDLSVTRGKGFTKEKNKKKRGSYRGGAIDTSGGKSFRFED